MNNLFNYVLTKEGIPVSGEPIHLPGPESPDSALCGHDLVGDPDLGYDGARQTTLKANCVQCCVIADFVKNISFRNYEKEAGNRVSPGSNEC